MKTPFATPIVLAGETFNSWTFNEVVILQDDTVIDTLEATDPDGNIIDCLSLAGIDETTELPKDTEINQIIQWPFSKIIVSVGSAQVGCTDFLPLP